MRYAIGTDDFGAVDRLGNESVRTEFACFILPLWPRRCFYQIGEGDDAVAVPLRMHPASIALGYARPWLWMLAVILGSATFADGWRMLWPVASGVAALAAVTTWGLGRLSTAEVARRQVLQRTLGLGAPPELLPQAEVARMRAALDGAWARLSDVDWREAIAQGAASDWLVAIAEYHQDPVMVSAAWTSLRRAERERAERAN